MIQAIKDFFNKEKRREQKILNEYGCICFCPKCSEPLNDNSRAISLDEYGLYEYICSNCGNKPQFHFGIAPLPICTFDGDKDVR